MASDPAAVSQEIKPESQACQPGKEEDMSPQPVYIREGYKGSGKLAGKVAIITGGDSGIGRAVAVHFAREGADVAIVYLQQHQDADKTRGLVEAEGRRCLAIAADVATPMACQDAVQRTVQELGRLDVLVNNASVQYHAPSLLDVTHLERTFRVNVCSYIYMAQAALPHLGQGSSIINCTAMDAYVGNPLFLDYTASKGAEVAFTRSLALQLADQGIRVNMVAPGPIWTPLIPACLPKESMDSFKAGTPMKRAGQPCEVATSFVFLASDDASYITGQAVHVNGGIVVNA